MEWLAQGLVIGVGSGLVLAGFQALGNLIRRLRQIRTLRRSCLIWYQDLRDGKKPHEVEAHLVWTCESHLPYIGQYLSTKDATAFARAVFWMRDSHPARHDQTHYEIRFISFAKACPFLKLPTDRPYFHGPAN